MGSMINLRAIDSMGRTWRLPLSDDGLSAHVNGVPKGNVTGMDVMEILRGSENPAAAADALFEAIDAKTANAIPDEVRDELVAGMQMWIADPQR